VNFSERFADGPIACLLFICIKNGLKIILSETGTGNASQNSFKFRVSFIVSDPRCDAPCHEGFEAVPIRIPNSTPGDLTILVLVMLDG